tara:strand:+ start:718 stop:1530 length:813 start_codon:yes stop_codon:yes gene_type:complete
MRAKTRDQGYLTFAQGEQYLECAYLLALSVKTYCKINDFAVVVDTATPVPEYMLHVFDKVITIPTMAPFASECLAWELTPFKETFKVESDMLITSNIDHWWAGCRLRNVCFTTQVNNYRGEIVDDTEYRSLWSENMLLNAYNGFMYFRHCTEAQKFFERCKTVQDNFSLYKNTILSNCRHDVADTDVFMSIAATELGSEQFYVPTINYPTFTHMKKHINKFKTDNWQDSCHWTLTDDMTFCVNGYAQTMPFHYYNKNFCTQELIKRYGLQ